MSERLAALSAILARPDPDDLPARGHALKYEGDPDRRKRVLEPLRVAAMQYVYLAVDREDLPIARRGPCRARRRKAS